MTVSKSSFLPFFFPTGKSVFRATFSLEHIAALCIIQIPYSNPALFKKT